MVNINELKKNDIIVLKYANGKYASSEEKFLTRNEIMKEKLLSVGRTQIWNILKKLEGIDLLRKLESTKPAKFMITGMGIDCLMYEERGEKFLKEEDLRESEDDTEDNEEELDKEDFFDEMFEDKSPPTEESISLTTTQSEEFEKLKEYIEELIGEGKEKV